MRFTRSIIQYFKYYDRFSVQHPVVGRCCADAFAVVFFFHLLPDDFPNLATTRYLLHTTRIMVQ